MKAYEIDAMMMRLGLDLPSVIANSYKNFHARGVDYICLSRTPMLTRKVYLFNGDVASFPEVVHPHDHRYAFKTKVIGGALRNAVYVPHPHGTVFNEFEWRTPLNGGTGFSWKREAKIKLAELYALRETAAVIAETVDVPCNGHPQIDAPMIGDARRVIAAAIRRI